MHTSAVLKTYISYCYCYCLVIGGA